MRETVVINAKGTFYDLQWHRFIVIIYSSIEKEQKNFKKLFIKQLKLKK